MNIFKIIAIALTLSSVNLLYAGSDTDSPSTARQNSQLSLKCQQKKECCTISLEDKAIESKKEESKQYSTARERSNSRF